MVGKSGRRLTDRERMHAVDNYTTTKSDKIRRITRLLLSNIENKSLDLTVICSIIHPSPKKTPQKTTTNSPWRKQPTKFETIIHSI